MTRKRKETPRETEAWLAVHAAHAAMVAAITAGNEAAFKASRRRMRKALDECVKAVEAAPND